MQYDQSQPLVDQLSAAATLSQDGTTRYLFVTVRQNLDDYTEKFFCDPSGDNLQNLIGLWTRAVRLLKDTPNPMPSGQAQREG